MMPYISLGNIYLPSYGVFAFFGLLVCLVIAMFPRANLGIGRRAFLRSLLGVFPWGYIGAVVVGYISKIGYILENEMGFLESIQRLTIVFYGGLLGGMLGLYEFARSNKKEFYLYADAYARLVPIFHAFGRVGCFCAGCCYGVEAQSLLSDAPGANGVVDRIPVQLFEAAGCLLLGIYLLTRKGVRRRGWYFWRYISCYAVFRFALEFLRDDAIRGIWFGLSTSQWVSLALLSASAVQMLSRYVAKGEPKACQTFMKLNGGKKN